ncbi:Ribokinase-like protein [Geopyxis carbonaria]|nr:Ribokinase-like protein [Geopyxis carbonaria]
MSRTILTVGSLNTDLVTTTPRLPSAGETLASTSFTTHPGGKGLNQCIATQRLSRASATSPSPSSITTLLAGALGTDAFAAPLLSCLSTNGITDHTLIKHVPATPSGTAVIIVDASSGENRILYAAGANANLAPADFPHAFFATHPCALVVLQLETPLRAVMRVIDLAFAAGVPVLLNAAPAVAVPAGTLAKVTYLVVNETEAAALAGMEVARLDSEDGVHVAAHELLKRGPKAVVVTLGARGCYWVDRMGEGGLQGVFVHAERVERVVDTTGAGDTWVGAFAVAVTEGRGLREAVEWAGRAAAVAVGRRGALESVPWRGEVEGEGEGA